jgi:hypothetical protein
LKFPRKIAASIRIAVKTLLLQQKALFRLAARKVCSPSPVLFQEKACVAPLVCQLAQKSRILFHQPPGGNSLPQIQGLTSSASKLLLPTLTNEVEVFPTHYAIEPPKIRATKTSSSYYLTLEA